MKTWEMHYFCSCLVTWSKYPQWTDKCLDAITLKVLLKQIFLPFCVFLKELCFPKFTKGLKFPKSLFHSVLTWYYQAFLQDKSSSIQASAAINWSCKGAPPDDGTNNPFITAAYLYSYWMRRCVHCSYLLQVITQWWYRFEKWFISDVFFLTLCHWISSPSQAYRSLWWTPKKKDPFC